MSEDLVTVTNNENTTIDLEITVNENLSDVNFAQSIDSVISGHNQRVDVHIPLREELTNNINLLLAEKVNKVSGKALSTNDLTDILKSNYNTAYTNNHTHSNEAALDLVSGTNTGDQDLSNLATKSLNNITATAGNNLNSAGIRTVVDTYVNGNFWYRVYSDGWIEQGGVSGSMSNSSISVTLLKSFSNTNYSVICSNYDSTSSTAYETHLYSKSTSYFTLYSREIQTHTVYWFACGY